MANSVGKERDRFGQTNGGLGLDESRLEGYDDACPRNVCCDRRAGSVEKVDCQHHKALKQNLEGGGGICTST